MLSAEKQIALEQKQGEESDVRFQYDSSWSAQDCKDHRWDSGPQAIGGQTAKPAAMSGSKGRVHEGKEHT